MSTRRPVAEASPYHHGDLANALVEAASALARQGGPDAVVLREVARQVGVSPAAAYHHFANYEQLIQAVKHRALEILTEAMRTAAPHSKSPPPKPSGRGPRSAAAEAARHRLRALGEGYIGFAFSEPGLFRVIFGHKGAWPFAPRTGSDNPPAGPFRLLAEALDELVAAGGVPASRRAGLEYSAWAAAHGIAMLCLDGPLSRLDPSERQVAVARTLDAIIRGL
jgi:AcrR family transcriptional regulator